jgi:hypothetical protein
MTSINFDIFENSTTNQVHILSMNSCKVLSSKNLSSEWNRFPMFEINRNIDSILNPRRYPFITSPDRSFVSEL